VASSLKQSSWVIFVSLLELAYLFPLNGKWSAEIHSRTQFFLHTVRHKKHSFALLWLILVLPCSALFYGGYGVILIPALGIADAYGGYTPEYHNALGFFVLCELHI
jgi:hypothetical protein